MPAPRKAPVKKNTKPHKGKGANASTERVHTPRSSPLPSLPPSNDEAVPEPAPAVPEPAPAQPQPAPAKTKRKDPPPRSPLPERSTCVQKPDAPDTPCSKRTSDEVEAAEQELAALKAQVAQLHQERVEALARMELTQDAEANKAAASTVMSESLKGAKKAKPIIGASFGRCEQEQELDPDGNPLFLEFSDEDFDAQVEADERIHRALKAEKIRWEKEADRYNLDKLPALALAPAKQSKARQKGSARAAIEEAKDKIGQKRALGSDSDLEEEASSDPSTKKFKPVFPSGTVKDWRNKVKVVGTTKQSKKTAGAPTVGIGGLDDDDVDDMMPASPDKKNTIEILSDSEDETPTKPRPQPVPKYRNAPTVVKSEGKSQPKPIAKKLVAKAESMAQDSDVAGLPEFARSGWVGKFFPTWYHYIRTRKPPYGWDICEIGDEERVIQRCLDLAFPGNGYKVRKGCPIYVTAMGRLGDKRHLIGVMTGKIVDTFFATPDYADKPKKIARYAAYAIDDNGPAWYESPTPRGTFFGSLGYAPPTGLFRSNFCIVPLTAYVKSTAKSKGDFGNRFVSATAMICTGLERAFNQYTTGFKTLNGEFSKGKVGEYVKDFSKAANRLEDWRWNKIASCCIAQMQSTDGHLISASASMNVDRGTMALGSSPVKGSDDDEV
ncbi:hypothetical protein MVEN_01969100 [Mycena venus]|uniref:Uncharacterized protein n=1 Tax=Mycena venus TaxID=2733690 RepID=A0A8H6XEF5_9AGAR|nr:hypothetical protein MVEN_01969100 [Mycena venus]